MDDLTGQHHLLKVNKTNEMKITLENIKCLLYIIQMEQSSGYIFKVFFNINLLSYRENKIQNR